MHGPEIVNLRAGAFVVPSVDTLGLPEVAPTVDSAAAARRAVRAELDGVLGELGRALEQRDADAIRVSGGNVRGQVEDELRKRRGERAALGVA